VAAAYLDSRKRLGFPMAPRAWAEEVTAKLDAEAAKAAARDAAKNDANPTA
jgi:glycyl-tRNA synthetase alpha chain